MGTGVGTTTETIKVTRNKLKVLPCLSRLGTEELKLIERKSYVKKIAKNDVLFSSSDELKFLYIIVSGAVKLFKASEEGREIVIKTMTAGEHFCCAPLYTDRKQVVNAIAIEETSVICIPAETFLEMVCNGLSGQGIKILQTLCARVQHLSKIVEDLTFKDVENRVLSCIIEMASEKSPSDNIVSLNVTHQEIASMTGSVREVVSRTMSKLKKAGIILERGVKEFKVDKQLAATFLKK
ncbi:Crp/Fnr family transcriptional regulator [Candidatus Magnetominusculus xianensis]|uniref:Transcriptional regulator n=1 Tax=Candidatus Magnetominusculus xianensis TaxID=1748249 RepID=A0ABR5SFC4_9BACT|nr:Crp/Fnr family transcriptional regulator [Candidatus Magnetominusculus xianensis]KWT85903.1 transcriptional regulator [Candidatus Magnetominusculus xianensis]MBF0403576.1 Crp/Fnr family transcriptional regulator [Nitrospirota bacterium]